MKVIESHYAFQGRLLKLRVDTVEVSPGQRFNMEIIEHSGAVAMLPIDDDGMIYLVRQYRHATGGELLEVPAGTLEVGEDPLECAGRELQEEIGMRAAQLELLTEFFIAPGYTTEFLRVYLATGLTPASLPGDADEDITVERMPVAEALAMLKRGEFRDAKTQLAMLWLAQRQQDD